MSDMGQEENYRRAEKREQMIEGHVSSLNAEMDALIDHAEQLAADLWFPNHSAPAALVQCLVRLKEARFWFGEGMYR